MRLGCAGVLAGVIGVTAWLVSGGPELVVNQAQARAMLPAIEAYLGPAMARQGFEYLRPQLASRVFCTAHIVEIRSDGPRWSVGLMANCGEFARRGTTLVEGSAGYPGIGEVMILSGRAGQYRVRSFQLGPDGSDPAWIGSHFSPAAAAQMLSANPPTAPDPISQAWRAFGFPPGTPAVQSLN